MEKVSRDWVQPARLLATQTGYPCLCYPRMAILSSKAKSSHWEVFHKSLNLCGCLEFSLPEADSLESGYCRPRLLPNCSPHLAVLEFTRKRHFDETVYCFDKTNSLAIADAPRGGSHPHNTSCCWVQNCSNLTQMCFVSHTVVETIVSGLCV